MKDGFKLGCGVVLAIIVVIIACGTLGVVTGIIDLPFFAANKTVQTAHDVVDKTLDADNVIYNYEWFKNQYNSYLALQQKVKNAKDSLKRYEDSLKSVSREKWSYEQNTQWGQLNTIVDGFNNQLNDCIAQYNSNASKANRNIFKSKDLPDHLE
jgi:hypothetical protein